MKLKAMPFLLVGLALSPLLASCSSDDSKSESEIPKSNNLHNGSGPIVTTGDEEEKPKSNDDPKAETGLRVKAVLAWKRGEPLPNEDVLNAARAALKDTEFAASAEGKALQANLKMIDQLAKAAALKDARNKSAKEEANESGSDLPAIPTFNRDIDSAFETMAEPAGAIEVKEAINAALDGELVEGAQRNALFTASNLTKISAIGYAVDQLIGDDSKDFDALSDLINEMVLEWSALNADWKSFLTIDKMEGPDKTEMLWRYSKAWEILEPFFR